MLAQFKMMIVSMFMAVNAGTSQPAINIDNINVKEAACLSQAVHGEAGNQSFKGKIAVAYTILNRTKDDDFPGGVCEVIRQRGQFHFKPKHLELDSPGVLTQVEDSVKAATMVMNGDVQDPTKGALYFVNTKISKNQGWLRNLRRIARIDDHDFYGRKRKVT